MFLGPISVGFLHHVQNVATCITHNFPSFKHVQKLQQLEAAILFRYIVVKISTPLLYSINSINFQPYTNFYLSFSSGVARGGWTPFAISSNSGFYEHPPPPHTLGQDWLRILGSLRHCLPCYHYKFTNEKASFQKAVSPFAMYSNSKTPESRFWKFSHLIFKRTKNIFVLKTKFES